MDYGFQHIDSSQLRPAPDELAIRPRWVVVGVVLSLFLHAVLILAFRETSLTRYGDPYFERLVPRTFKLERVEIDPAVLESGYEPTNIAIQTPPQKADMTLPEEKTDFAELLKDVRVTPDAPSPDATKDLIQEKPSVTSRNLQNALDRAAEAARAAREMDTADITAELLREQTGADNRPILDVNAGDPRARSGDTAADMVASGFSNLDALLSRSGPVENQPILMDAGLLFDYDDYRLRGGAVTDLAKLGQLIARTPGARLIIEGHSDLFGSDEYNLELSRRRAESVKDWVVQNLGIPPQNVSTVGYGKTRPIVGGATPEEQQMNRRVEIVIKRQAFRRE